MWKSSYLPLTALAALAAMLSVGGLACRKPPAELAPAKEGDWFEYKITIASGQGESTYQTRLELSAGEDADHHTLSGKPDGGEAPVQVDKALDAGKPIKLHFIGQLWLPSAHRAAAAITQIGNVQGQKRWNGRDTWVVDGKGSARGTYYFEAATGFLVGYEIPIGGGTQSAFLLSSSVVPAS